MHRLSLALLLALSACDGTQLARECEANSDCLQGSVRGECRVSTEGSGANFCAYPDGACSSGYRWGVAAGDGLAEDCVDAKTVDAGMQPDASTADAGTDAAIDAGSPTTSWSTPTDLLNVSTTNFIETGPSVSANGLELYLAAYKPPGSPDILVAKRSSTTTPFDIATPLTVVNSTGYDFDPEVSASGLELYFIRGSRLWVSTRPSVTAAWGAPAAVPLTGRVTDPIVSPALTADGLTMYFVQRYDDACGNGANGACVKHITRLAIGQPWSAVPDQPDNLGSLQYLSVDISHDGLTLLLCSRANDNQATAVESHRASTSAAFTVFSPILTFNPLVKDCEYSASGTEMYVRKDNDLGVSVPQ